MTITELKTDLAEKIRAKTGENVFLCYQCVKCTSGCPLAEYFDLAPNQVMRAAQLGRDEMALNAKTPWLCAGCQTCTTRCPQGIDVAKVMDFMAREAVTRGIPAKVPEVALFNKVFLRNVDIIGRAYELGLILELNLRTGRPFKDVAMGLEMIGKGKVSLTPEFARPPKHAKPVERRQNQIGYYPGCSLHSMASEYDHSIHAVAAALGLELVEPEGWVCCGSSPAHRVDPELAVKLPSRNMAMLEQMGMDEVAVPCAMCFSRLRTARHELDSDPALKAQMEAEVGHRFADSVAVRSLLDVLVNRIGLDKIADQVKKPLDSLKVACYYGCLLTRPPKVTQATQVEYPVEMDRLVSALGATPVEWGGKTTCCGASLSITRTDIVLDLSAHILAEARAAGAEAVVVACPLCHANLDGRQHQMTFAEGAVEIPELYFTQLMALAFCLGAKAAALSKNM
ncbi:MAG: 4Fe-4S dicluster domain-containing protein, partial [Chloroflexi bacterium]|nr:4Fe-4S dicluster domain-containing protein [Chloroflexota bacterium]